MAREKTRAHARHANLPATFLLRVVLLASVAVIGSVWALVRYYTHPMKPMMVPAPASQVWDAGAGLVEVDTTH